MGNAFMSSNPLAVKKSFRVAVAEAMYHYVIILRLVVVCYGTSMVRVTSVWRWSHSERAKASLTPARG